MKDDSGSYAVFTEQRSSASQMRAAKVMDIISRLPGCSGQTADAVSAKTQVKWKMHQRYVRFQSQNGQIFGYVHGSTNSQNHGPVWKIQLFFSKGICTVIPCQRTVVGKAIRESSIRTRLGKVF